LYAAIVGVLRAKFNTNEIITSLMLNYIAGIFLSYLIYNSTSYWRDPVSKNFPAGKPIADRAEWNFFEFVRRQNSFGVFRCDYRGDCSVGSL